MQLSKHFSLGEFTRSATATSLNIDNSVTNQATVENLRQLANQVLEPLRCRFGVLRITSGYRCAELNKKVGGAPHSQHLTGQAADLHISNRQEGRKMMGYAQEQHLPFDQMIVEYNPRTRCLWLHVSHCPNPRRQCIDFFVKRQHADKQKHSDL